MSKGYKRRIVLDFDYDQVKEGIHKVNDQMRILNAEYKATQAEVKATGNQYDYFATRQTFLQNEIKITEKVLAENTKRLEEATEKHGDGSKQVEKYSKEVALSSAKLRELTSDLDKVNKDLEKNKLILGKTSDEWEKLSKKTTDIGKSMSLKVTAPIVAAGTVAFKMASDYEQALGKVETVFEGSAVTINKWAENSLKNFGLAKSTATEMAADFGALLKGMDISDAKTREWSMELTERVMDLSAFYDTSVEETNNALMAIVTGQTEPLRRFGINMTQATLQEYAYSQGLQKKISDMTETEKVQLRYNFVMKQTSIAVGTMQKESGSANFQMALMKENAKEVGLSIGENLLPIIVPILEGVNNLLTAFNSLDNGTKQFIIRILGITAAIGPMLIMVGSVFKALSNVSGGIKAVSDIGKAFSSLLDNTKFLGFLKWAAIIAAVATVIYLVISAINDLIGRASSAERVFGNIGSSIGNINGIVGQAETQINQSTMRGYAVGTNYVDRDQDARIHKGEAIIPENENPWNPNAKKPFGFGGGNTYIMQVDAERIKSVTDLINIFENFTQVANAGMVIG